MLPIEHVLDQSVHSEGHRVCGNQDPQGKALFRARDDDHRSPLVVEDLQGPQDAAAHASP